MIKVGQKVRFDPYDNLTGFGVGEIRGNLVTGTVVYVNESHNWFSVKYGNNQRTSFHFCQIGRDVKVCG